MTRAISVLMALGVSAACVRPPVLTERRYEQSFKVSPSSVVKVDLAGGSVSTSTGDDGLVEVVVHQRARTTRGERAVDALLDSVDLSVVQDGSEIRLVQRRRPFIDRSAWFWDDELEIRASVIVPANVALELNTRGGRVSIRGERTAGTQVRTSGGAITADGGTAEMLLGTSGGSITVGRALGVLQAETRGGRLSVGYIAPSARRVELGTSGGSIRVGIDPKAPLTVLAATRGGSVTVDDLELDGYTARRSYVSGTMNGGTGGSFRASTSGGNITVRSAPDPGPNHSRGGD